jgi:hypothetical protein
VTHVFINERDVGQIGASDAALGEVVEAVRVHVDPQEIITAIEIDGVRYRAGEDERWAQRPAAGVARLALVTETPAVFVAEKRRDLAAAVTVIAHKVGMVAELFRQPDERAANGLLAALMEELRLALLLEQQLAVLGRTAASAAREEIFAFAPILLEAQERRQWSRLVDLLETRLVPVLEGWSAAVAPADAEPAA